MDISFIAKTAQHRCTSVKGTVLCSMQWRRQDVKASQMLNCPGREGRYWQVIRCEAAKAQRANCLRSEGPKTVGSRILGGPYSAARSRVQPSRPRDFCDGPSEYIKITGLK